MSQGPVILNLHVVTRRSIRGILWYLVQHSRAFWLGSMQGWALMGIITGKPWMFGLAILAGSLCWLTQWIGR